MKICGPVFKEALERNLRAKLHRARITNASDSAEVRASGYVQAGEAPEVGVVENVEDLGTEL
jgi:hypothetical protein